MGMVLGKVSSVVQILASAVAPAVEGKT